MSTLEGLLSQEHKAQLVTINRFRAELDAANDATTSDAIQSDGLPHLLRLLRETTPCFFSLDMEQQVRMAAMETLQRFSFTEAFRPAISDLMTTIMQLLRTDNEDIACICLKLYIDLHKAYKNSIEEFVQPFLDFVLKLYQNMPDTVRNAFGNITNSSSASNRQIRNSAALSSPSPLPTSEGIESTPSTNKSLNKSLESFRVLTECPIIIVLLFSTYRQNFQAHLVSFMPAIIEMLSLQAPAPSEDIVKGSPTATMRKQIFADFMLSQIKTLSFLAYVLRGYPAFVKKYMTAVPPIIMHLLENCPPEMSAARKELLVATRHILSTEIRTACLDKVETLLDEKVLIGTSVTAWEALRPLAYSMLADLIHHVRADLTYVQIRKTIVVYSANMLDSSLSSSIQTMSAKLLLNMIDKIMKLPNQAESRHLLMLILKSFTEKIAMLNNTVLSSLAISKDINIPELLKEQGILVRMPMIDQEPEPLLEGRSLFKNLIIGLKTIIFGLKTCNPPLSGPMTTQQWGESVRGLSYVDTQIFINLFQYGSHGFSLYHAVSAKDRLKTSEIPSLENHTNIVLPDSRDEKDILETFATVFIHLDPAAFQEIFDASLSTFYEKSIDNAILLHIPQFFLTNDATSPNFAGLLLQFLVERLEELGSSNSVRSSVLLRLFKMCFMAVTMFPDLNEPVLQPHLANIIIQSMKLSATADNSIAYYILMRALFRSIGGGRFESLYKEVLPLLQVLLECLNTLLQAARKPQEKELFVELCLTVPVRLSVLLPYLSYLMKPLAIALTAGPDLVTQGLRTLELCIDNLTQEFLDPILAPVLPELMEALWSHLRPLPHNHHHSHSALRILGKLGGRNRRFIGEHETFDSHMSEIDQPFLQLSFHGSGQAQQFRWMQFVPYATRVIQDLKMLPVYKEKAFAILSGTVKMFFENEPDLPLDMPSKLRSLARELVHAATSDSDTAATNPDSSIVTAPRASQSRTNPKILKSYKEQEHLFKQALSGLFSAASVPTFEKETRDLVLGLTRHFVFTQILRDHKEMGRKKATFSIDAPEEDCYMSAELLYDVLVTVFESESQSCRTLAEECVICIHETSALILGSDADVSSLQFFDKLTNRLCHSCFQEAWYCKTAGVVGLSILIEKLNMGTKWYQAHQIDMVRALLYVIKDVMPEISTQCATDAVRLLEKIVENGQDSDDPGKLATSPLVTVLISELSNPNSKVREATQKLFRTMAKLSSTSVQSIITPVQERLLSPIFTKPLRALPFAMQIGHIDAITFCLSLSPSFLEYNEGLIRLLLEALSLSEAEDDALVSVTRTSQYKSSSALVNLRIVCIKLLTIAVSSAEFATQQTQSRSRMIAVFFKSLYSKSSEVVEVANTGLKQVLFVNSKLPKDLLQAGLRPILMNLADHKSLTVLGLEGLARLLVLLTNYFKVEVGKKLLDHLQSWADPDVLQQISGKPLRDEHSIKIMAAILNVIHLLPPSANLFMDDLIMTVSKLEETLRRGLSSPLRPPLLRFIMRYPTETWTYFRSKIEDAKLTQFMLQLADDPINTAWRKVMQKELDDLLRELDTLAETPTFQYRVSLVIQIFATLSRHGDSLVTRPETLSKLAAFYCRVFQPSSRITSSLDSTGNSLIEIYFKYLNERPLDIPVLLELIRMQSERLLDQSIEVDDFILKIFSKETLECKRELFIAALDVFPEQAATQMYKLALFSRIINPLLLCDKSSSVDHKGLIDKALVDTVHSKVWKTALSDFGEDVICSNDMLRIELLQMSTILIRGHTEIVANVRKDVLKFAWNYIKLEDTATKNTAYVCICYFVAAYDIPAKMVAQIYFALLKTTQPETRVLVKQALDALAPVLAKRIPPSSDARSPSWAKYSKLVMTQENNAMQLIPVYQFITRHSDIFSICRDQFSPHLLAGLAKVAFPQSVNLESQNVAIDILATLLQWAKDDEVAMETENSSTVKVLSSAQLEQLLRVLFKFLCTPIEHSKKDHTPRILEVIRGFMQLQLTQTTKVPIQVFEPFLEELNEKVPIVPSNALRALSAILEHQSRETVLEESNTIILWIDKALRSESMPIQIALQPVLQCMLASLPTPSKDVEDEESGTEAELVSKISAVLQENLQGNINLPGNLLLLNTLANHSASSLDALVSHMLKVFNNLIKEHIVSRTTTVLAAPGQASQTGGNASPVNASTSDPELSSDAIISLMDLLCQRIMHLGEQRRVFVAALAQLIEKSPSAKICSHILDIVTDQVINKRQTFPTIKEKVSLLLKMTSFEGRGNEALVNQFLNLIISIYRDPTNSRSELTVRLEQAFLMGTRAHSFEIRNEFMDIFNASMSKSIYMRFNYIFAVQNWESLSTHFWIHQANQLLLGSIVEEKVLTKNSNIFKLDSLTSPIPGNGDDIEMADDSLSTCIESHKEFLGNVTKSNPAEIIKALGQLQHLDQNCGDRLWSEVLPLAWSALHAKDRKDISRSITAHLAKEYHLRQVDKRPNVVQTLLKGISRCTPHMSLPPHLVKYLGKTFNAWYIAIDLLENSANDNRIGESLSNLQESTLDALTELYASLSEDDMFYGLWRLRCKYLETNAAISYEQNGYWVKAQQLYEQAQVKARTGTVPFLESEYTLWEDHWILCAQKLQQWDVLTDLAKQEGYSDLLLECAWRVSDWTTDKEPLEASVRTLMDVPTPRRYTFEAFMALQKSQSKLDALQDFQRICDEGMQLSLRKWHQLPNVICQAHLPLLQSFQQYVELQEASQIYGSLATTHAQNLESKSHELKHILQTWRERLPNFYDDINSWSDLVAWRQLVFATINRTYLPLVPTLQQPAAPNANSSATSFAYRGYHETAWIINRFAHVARKHQLPDVCINQLTKIYTLPNIEIQEAFLKLREQAKCHYQNSSELNQGLEVISNTNLMYFGVQQKAEFFTLKGMFLAKLKLNDDANQAFATAIQIDLSLPKAWAEWGQYSDRLFQEDPTELTKAGNAVSCYLQAAGLYKNGRARNMLSRVLWLLSLDDAEGTIASAFDSYKGEVPTWYWVTFIPQLLTSLSHKEARHARSILIRIAKSFPQSLHFQLRTTKEDYAVIKKQALVATQNISARNKAAATTNPAVKTESSGNDQSKQEGNGISTTQQTGTTATPTAPSAPVAPTIGVTNGQTADTNATQSPQPHGQNTGSRQPWEHVEEIMSILKTAYPLLALSMETMVDQIQQKFKCSADEDAYRLIVALLNDGVQHIGRLVNVTAETMLPQTTQANVTRFAESVLPKNIKAAFEQEFVHANPNLQEYVAKLRKWRDKFEVILDRRCQTQQLEQVSLYLSEFQYQKFDEVEVPGQYLQHKDNNADFVRIDRFLPTLEVVRGNGVCHRRLSIRGHDGSKHQFAVQYPAARHCRREERIVQLFRILSGVLTRRKESRKRSLGFHLPVAVPLAPHIRIVEDDSSSISLQGIYEDYCARNGQHKDDPLRLSTQKIQQAPEIQHNKQALIDLKVEILGNIQQNLVPDTIVLDFFKHSYASFAEFWQFRKQFAQKYASLTFMTYIMNINNRFPHKLYISRGTGKVWGTEILPGMATHHPLFQNTEAVPFRFTPTIQTLMGQISVEGVFACSLMAIARCLTEGEFELDQNLSVFVRDELITWHTTQHRPVNQETQLPEKVAHNVGLIVKRASSLAQTAADSNVPAYQTITDLISAAVNPRNLAQMDQLWCSFL